MPTDPETRLALAAVVQRLANRAGVAMPPSPAAVVTIARGLELAAHAEVERAVRRVREEGQGWTVVASLLGLAALPCHVENPARLAFDYCAGLTRPPEFDEPQFLWDCPACRHTIAGHGPAGNPARSQQGHANACGRLAADVAEWQRGQQARR
jgi:hypothetical protein